MRWIPRRLRDALRRVWVESNPNYRPTPGDNQTYIMEAEWHGRSDRYFPGDITSKMLENEDPDFKPPTAGPKDRWRPRKTLGPS